MGAAGRGAGGKASQCSGVELCLRVQAGWDVDGLGLWAKRQRAKRRRRVDEGPFGASASGFDSGGWDDRRGCDLECADDPVGTVVDLDGEAEGSGAAGGV